MSLCIPLSSRSPDHNPHRTIYYLGHPVGRFAGLKHRRQEAEGQLQQERATLVDARSALEREHAALERAQTSLKEREAEVPKLDGELIALIISNADQLRTLEEQSAMVVSLQQAVESGRQALEGERKQVEGESPLRSFV
jgi:chromosome segregation ATPase